ncbi:MAG: 3-phosphoshikimate 1-carboxyvinyltransferase [Flavobacteriales bacterium]|nr:3-phosphoshikimate 1-carboxyvinyltransferase [Flavobacteriales bacterium]
MKLLVPNGPLTGEVELPISKSIANRYQIIAALAGKDVKLPNSLPEDVKVLRDALSSNSDKINIGMAGTAMRFLTAYYSAQEGKSVVLTGDERMKQRPISELVTVLRELGSVIDYVENDGFPPLKIVGKKLKGGKVEISASVSSQFVSALMMIAPRMKDGLTILLDGKVLSRPYIELTADCMRQSGIEVQFQGNTVDIAAGNYQISNLDVEADWSAASYFYALAAARPNSKFLLKGLKLNSSQGDSILKEWFLGMGVTSVQKENGVEISSIEVVDFPKSIDFTHNPDLAQTFAFLAVTLGKSLALTGLDNLRFKETDRLKALKWELKKLGVYVAIRGDSLTVSGSISAETAVINTYNDHRMAMSAAVLSTVMRTEIENPEVVEKSFPTFWSELQNIGFKTD